MTSAKYTDGEIGRVRVVEDFLPAPDELVARKANVKVTLLGRAVARFAAPPRR